MQVVNRLNEIQDPGFGMLYLPLTAIRNQHSIAHSFRKKIIFFA